MRFKATDVFDYYKPSPCARRVSYIARGIEQEQRDDPFMDLLVRLGHEHEARHLAAFPGILDLSIFQDRPDERERRTLTAIAKGAPAIYQARFRQTVVLDGNPVELIGEPDFLIRSGAGGYRVRDSKLARAVLEKRHAGIPLQLQIYGYLYELATGSPPACLEIHTGGGEIVPVPYDGAAAVLETLRGHVRMRAAEPGIYEPVGWTKCGGCGYETRCRTAAEAARDVALLPAVGRKRALDLHARGITTIEQIAGAVDDPAHRDYFWTGRKNPRRKEFVEKLLRSAEAFTTNAPVRLARPALPDAPSFAVFDVEGLPPNADELDRTYLWGLKVFGERPGPYMPALSGFGTASRASGDRDGWFAFLANVERLFAEYGPKLPIVCWSGHEKGRVAEYVERYGDRDNLAKRLLENLVDLLAEVRASVVLPLPSYSLKVVERFVGYRRRLSEADGAWSMAKYIEAVETSDRKTRDAIMAEILAYNEEDLDATRAVMEWLGTLVSAPAGRV